MKEFLVYVIELDQPFINWFGTFEGFDFDNVDHYLIKNSEGEIISVRGNVIYETDTNMPILEYLIYALQLRQIEERKK